MTPQPDQSNGTWTITVDPVCGKIVGEANRYCSVDGAAHYAPDRAVQMPVAGVRAIYDAIAEQERLRAALRTANRQLSEARKLLSPGMRAGVGEAKAILDDGIRNISAALDEPRA